MSAIPFERIQAATLAQADRLLREWFPRGKRIGREFRIGNIAGDAGGSMSVNLDTGLWADFAGDHKGHDLIDLRAAIRHGCDRLAAGHELGVMLGIIGNGHDRTEPRRHNGTGKTTADAWAPIVPPPPNAVKPADREFAGFDAIYDYRAADDRLLFYVRRREARDGQRKLFVPLTYGSIGGKIGWHSKAPGSPRPLYGLNRLSTMPDATVILCEGEKSANAARRCLQIMCASHGVAEQAQSNTLTSPH